MNLVRSLFVLFLVLSVAFASAPSWISVGTSINYTVGSNIYTFTVTEVSSSQVKIDLKTPTSTSRLIDNASGDVGQFWFDPTLLSTASAGRSIGDYSVTATSDRTYAGKNFRTATLQIVFSGVTTTKIFDVESGLLLDQTTSASGSSPVILRNYYVPAWAAPPPNVTAPTPIVNTTPSTPPPTPTAPPPTTPTPSPSAPTSTPPTQTNQTPSVPAPTSSTSSGTCPCPESLFFVLLGFLAFGKKVEKI